jgi:hypothetical protein
VIETKVNLEENKKNRHLVQKKSALIAKSSFIEENYDYCTNVKEMEGGVFRQIQDSNTEVRQNQIFNNPMRVGQRQNQVILRKARRPIKINRIGNCLKSNQELIILTFLSR